MAQHREIKKIALSRPVDQDLAFSTWSLAKLAEFLVAEGVVDDISHEGLRVLLCAEGASCQVIKTWKQSTDLDFEAKSDPDVVVCMDEFGPLNLRPRRGRQWGMTATGAS